MHEELLQSYLAGGQELAEVLDDGYFMQNVGHHLITAKRFRDLEKLLTNAAWLESKLHSYGVASVVADYRRCRPATAVHAVFTLYCCLPSGFFANLFTIQLRMLVILSLLIASVSALGRHGTTAVLTAHQLEANSNIITTPISQCPYLQLACCLPCRYLMCVNDDQVKLLLETVQMSVSSCMQHPELPTLRPQMVGRLMAAHHSATVAV